jgi:hypothetical protein
MKRMLLASFGVLVFGTSALAQRGAPAPPAALEPGASQAEVDKALLAAPEGTRNGAMVIKWNPANWTYTTLRKGNGSNSVVCFDKSGLPGQQPAFSVECTIVGNLDRAAQNMKFESEPDRVKRQAALDAAEKDGTRVKPMYGSVWWHLRGADQASATTHMTIAVPMATTASTGIPDNNKQGGVWIMNPGTTTAHLMVPGE